MRQCPGEYVTDDIWQAIRLARLYEKGLPVDPGTSLDQAGIFVAMAEFVWQEEKQYKDERWASMM